MPGSLRVQRTCSCIDMGRPAQALHQPPSGLGGCAARVGLNVLRFHRRLEWLLELSVSCLDASILHLLPVMPGEREVLGGA